MGRKKSYIAMIALIGCMGSAMAQDYFDDVYYNPKKDNRATKQEKVTSTYISNMGDMDVDLYNRRGEQYYVSQIDTIGSRVENGEDFVYTQQIQKYYNPTIVVENASNLGDILANARGNVEIVINDNGYPVFSPWYGYSWWPYYSSVWSPWSWGINVGPWGWSIGWNAPIYSWSWGWGPGWGPAWGPAWGPGWAPGWGPGWGPGPGGPGWRPGPMAHYAPRANRPVGPRPGWSNPAPIRNRGIGGGISSGGMHANNPQGGNYRGPANVGGGGSRPATAPGQAHTGVVNNNGRWQYNTTSTTGHRAAGTGVLSTPDNRQGGSVGTSSGKTQSTNKSTSSSQRQQNTSKSNVSKSNSNASSSTSNHRSVSNSNSSNRSMSPSRSSAGGRSAGARGGGGGGRRR